jgi:uncharacterized membrane protein
MNFTDWLINIALVLTVLRQIRWNEVDKRFVILPLALVGWAVSSYLKALPTGGNDLVLISIFVAVGITFGTLSALATDVRVQDGKAFVRARALAVALWVAGIGSRIAFVLYTEHGGAPAIAHFSASHNITTGDTWVDALVLMALAEVVTRIGILVLRSYRAVSADRAIVMVESPVRVPQQVGV